MYINSFFLISGLQAFVWIGISWYKKTIYNFDLKINNIPKIEIMKLNSSIFFILPELKWLILREYGPISFLLTVLYFSECDHESIQNRSCRTLANLAKHPGLCENIHKTDFMETLVSRMEATENIHHQQTYCRAVRYMSIH